MKNELKDVTSEVQAKALPIDMLDMSQKLSPGGSIEGYIVFEIPSNENPLQFYCKVGIVGGYNVTVNLG